jgi:protein phosphatase 1 regulatory subunit 7
MMSSEKESTPPHISIQNDDEEGHGSPKTNGTPRSSTGWDGKLRIEKEKKAELVNPEAISDPEYSDEEQVLPGQTIEADEGMSLYTYPDLLFLSHSIAIAGS